MGPRSCDQRIGIVRLELDGLIQIADCQCWLLLQPIQLGSPKEVLLFRWIKLDGSAEISERVLEVASCLERAATSDVSVCIGRVLSRLLRLLRDDRESTRIQRCDARRSQIENRTPVVGEVQPVLAVC